MTSTFDVTNRRDFLKTAGLGAGTLLLAGCIAGGEEPDDDVTYVDVEPDYRGWFDGVSNYRGTADLRGRSAVTVDVGVQGVNGFYYFGPAAIAVSPGTTVTWRWTGKGGTHNVVAETGAFDSGGLVDTSGTTFSHTFDEPRVYRYYCEPHRSMGMRGAVFVALDDGVAASTGGGFF